MKRVLTKVLVVMLAVVVFVGYLPLDTAEAATIKLNKTKVTTYVGKTVTLKITGTSKKVSWKSANKEIATVYKGKVKAKKAGTVTITAKVSGKKYKCKVTIKKPYLNKKTPSLYVGKTLKLKLTGATVKSFKSKNTAVATVNKYGKITAKKKGSAKIVVKDTKGRLYYCTVKVKNPYLNQTDLYLGIGKSLTLKITGATAESWSSSNKKVATVSSKGVVKAKYGGTATITCKAGNGKSYKAKVTVYCSNHTLATKITKNPTCQNTGIEKTYCTTCDYYYTRTLGMVDHEHKLSYTIAPTCEDYGRTYYACKWCGGDEYFTYYGLPGGHNYVYDGKVAPSKYGPGYDAYYCSECGDLDRRNKVDYYPTATQVYNDMLAMKSQYYEGMPWNNSNYYFWETGYTHAYGCAAFAYIVSDEVFGYLPAKKHYNFDNIKPGDILRVDNEQGGEHSIVVWRIDGNTYTLAEGNYNSSIHWGRTMTLSKIKSVGKYVMTRYPQ